MAGIRRVRGVRLGRRGPPGAPGRGGGPDPSDQYARPGATWRCRAPPRPGRSGLRRPGRRAAGRVQPVPGLAERPPGRAPVRVPRLNHRPRPGLEGVRMHAALIRYRVLAYLTGVMLLILV